MSDVSGLDYQATGENADLEKVSDAGDATPQETAGGLLRRAREAAGLHIAALAVLLKVPVKKLEALETDRFDLLPDAVFVRALASSVCRTLKIDATPVLQLLPQTNSPKLTYQGGGLNTPFHAPSDGPGPSMWSQVSKTAVLAGVLLLLAALVIILLPVLKVGLGSGNAGSDSKMTSSSVTGGAVALAEPRSTDLPRFIETAREEVVSEEKNPAVSQVLPASTASPAPLVNVPVAVVPVSSPSIPPIRPLIPSSSPASVAVASPASTAIAMPAPSTGIVVFTANSESWVEVTDSKGQVVLRRILGAGEVVGASGALPLSAVVGRVNATQVQIRGKAFDLSALAKDNVARFEVK
ncbi:MAG: helix-turn-helix domain-containing protein [Pseudomonadota bacterium]